MKQIFAGFTTELAPLEAKRSLKIVGLQIRIFLERLRGRPPGTDLPDNRSGYYPHAARIHPVGP